MIEDPELRIARFAALGRSSGSLALLALDQRESLRTMLRAAARPAHDDAIAAFKVEAVRVLSPLASAVLLDAGLGLPAVLDAAALAPGCGLIVAVDRLAQQPGGIVEATDFDATADLAALGALGAVAFKLLVLWRRDEAHAPLRRMVSTFVRRCADVGALSLVEGIVRPPRNGGPWDREADVLDAARELTSCRPDIYKAEVPTLGTGTAGEIEERSGRLTAEIEMPWVVLSAGVDPDRFPAAVAAACRGGASGFLAGRGVWARTISADASLAEGLRDDARARLSRLTSIVDDAARPWRAVVEASVGVERPLTGASPRASSLP